MIWATIWVAIVSVVCALALRSAYRLYRHPREIRNPVGSWRPDQSRRIALATLIGLPFIWLLIVLSSFGLLGRSPFETGAN
jgi:hypothetical protein